MADIEAFPMENDDRPLGWEGNATTTEMAALATAQAATLRAAVKVAKDGYISLLHRTIIEVEAMIARGVTYDDLPAIPNFGADDVIAFSQLEILTRMRDFDTSRSFTVCKSYFFFSVSPFL
jgi:hypothetical protein